MKLTFYIIYTPATVKYLRIFTLSLLKWSNCSFRLVSNGCLPDEANLLERFCRDNPRLEFFAFPSEALVRHGNLLSYLQKREKSDFFCFMDSDILATGDFLNEFIPYLDEHSAVFSGCPVWQKKEQSIVDDSFVPRIMGRFIESEKGLLFGCSYFAMYDNKKLSDFINSTGITFECRQWKDIPPQHQNRLENIGLKKDFYDTGKVLNILLADYGGNLVYRESPLLHHIGGISFKFLKYVPIPLKDIPIRIIRIIKKTIRFPKTIIKALRTKKSNHKHFREKWEAESKVQAAAAEYFAELLFTLFENLPLQANFNVDDSEIRDQVDRLKNQITKSYYEFKGQL